MYGTNSHAYSPTHEANQVPTSEHSGYPPPYQDQYSGYPPPPYTPDGAVSQGRHCLAMYVCIIIIRTVNMDEREEM